MAKFNVGDKVLRTKHGDSHVRQGNIYVVSKVSEDSLWICVEGANIDYFSGYFDLIEKVSVLKTNAYFDVASEQESKEIQLWLFEQGYEWQLSGEKVMYTTEKKLFADLKNQYLYTCVPKKDINEYIKHTFKVEKQYIVEPAPIKPETCWCRV